MCNCKTFEIGSETYIKRSLDETLAEMPKQYTFSINGCQFVEMANIPAYCKIKCKDCNNIYSFQYERK
jgi:hypothetical protein